MNKASEPTTLENCESEQIHLATAIQPHGVLIACRGDRLVISQVSANCAEGLGVGDVGALLGASLLSLLDESSNESLVKALSSTSLREANPIHLKLAQSGIELDATIHRSGEVLVVEGERPRDGGANRLVGFDPRLRDSARVLELATDSLSLMQAAAREVRRLTGFDRVMVYRFDEEWNGEVVAEARRDELQPFLGQHYPASDIPVQARRLYELNWLRFVGNVDDERVPLVPEVDPVTQEPLDLTFSILRSVSPIHIQYLKNMGVKASMSISLLSHGALNGLIACHHYDGGRVVPLGTRDTAEYLGRILSWQLRVVEDAQEKREAAAAQEHMSGLLRSITSNTELLDGLDSEALLRITDSHGAAVVLAEGMRRIGHAPPADVILEITHWLRDNDDSAVFETNCLERWIPNAAGWRDFVAGLIAVEISRPNAEFVLWFRPAIEDVVVWAGQPVPKTIGAESSRLTPRGSFEAWREVVKGRARRWERWQVGAGANLRHMLLGGVRTRAVALRTMNNRLLAADRAKDNFVALVGHELRTPLNAISGWAKILLGLRSGSDPRHGLEVIARNVSAQRQLIDDLLDMSRITSGKLTLEVELLDLANVVEDAAEACMLAANTKGISLRTHLARGQQRIRGDVGRLRQIATNLVMNAVKFTPKGGAVAVVVRHDGSAVVLEVSDNGQGIDPSFLPHVFDAFRQEDEAITRRTGGLGLGLAIVKRLVELHGGKIVASSDGLGRGALFRVVIPVTAVGEAAPVSRPIEHHPPENALDGKRILVVDDDDDSRDLICHILSAAGADVHPMPNAERALAAISKNDFDAMVSDIGMPDVDGFDLIRRVRALAGLPQSQLPAVALTAYARSSDRTAALAAGFLAHVAKPVDPNELVVVLQSLLKTL